MPYVTGESLRARLERETQLAVDDAVRIAREVLAALESAHKHGVVHRDIKPENILLHEDQALVADFGIALAVSAAGGARMTQTGLSLGTPAYMAPEQAMGERVIDGRADIYALGAVLYEMLVGEAPFTGPTVQAIVARVMTEHPRPVTGQRKSVPDHVNAAILQSLEKLPADRFHTAGEFSKALVTPGAVSPRTTEAPLAVATGKPAQRAAMALLPWSIAGLALIAAFVFAVRTTFSKRDVAPVQLSIETPAGVEIAAGGEGVGISGDGKTVSFGVVSGGRSYLMLRNLSEGAPRLVEGSIGARGGVDFSADGHWVAFGGDDVLMKAPVEGGAAIQLSQAGWAQPSWAGDRIIFTRTYNTGLYSVSSDGKDTTMLTSPSREKKELGHWWPQLLPDGEHVLFTTYRTPPDKSDVEVLSLRTRERKVVLEGGYFGRFFDGKLLFVRANAVQVMEFNTRSLKASGSISRVPLDIEINPTNGWAGFAVSNEGTLFYRSSPDARVDLVWVDDVGNEEPAMQGSWKITDVVPSPDGTRIAVIRDGDVWVYERARQLFTRLTRSDQREANLVWSPDSRFVYYVRDVPQFDIFRREAGGGSQEELVVTSEFDKEPGSVSRDGKFLLFTEDDDTAEDVRAFPLDSIGTGKARTILAAPGDQRTVRMSPDGQWMTYGSNESGRNEIYLSPYPADRGPQRQQLSVDGGDLALWGPDGRTVYFMWSGRINRVRVNPRTGEIGKPELLSRVPSVRSWDIGTDGRLIIGKPARDVNHQSLRIVLNWPALLAKKK
jgi:serine/threonine-protein kinase